MNLTDNDRNETIIPGKPTKRVLSQLEVERECVDNQFGKISDPGDPISSVADKTKLPKQSAVYVEDDKRSKDKSSPNATSAAVSKDVRDTRLYKNTNLYLRKFVNRNRNLHTEKEVSYIKTMLRFVRIFETTYPYPHLLKRELLMDTILFRKLGLLASQPREVRHCRARNRTLKKGYSQKLIRVNRLRLRLRSQGCQIVERLNIIQNKMRNLRVSNLWLKSSNFPRCIACKTGKPFERQSSLRA